MHQLARLYGWHDWPVQLTHRPIPQLIIVPASLDLVPTITRIHGDSLAFRHRGPRNKPAWPDQVERPAVSADLRYGLALVSVSATFVLHRLLVRWHKASAFLRPSIT